MTDEEDLDDIYEQHRLKHNHGHMQHNVGGVMNHRKFPRNTAKTTNKVKQVTVRKLNLPPAYEDDNNFELQIMLNKLNYD